jgi:tRNA pseudouridine55 synthase
MRPTPPTRKTEPVSGRPQGEALRRPRQALDGVLLLDKPKGPGSTSVLGRAKFLLNAAKAGHTGTLDPLASGLLPLCFGEATKFAQDLLDASKSYRATMQLGIITSSGDAEGETLDRRPVRCTVAQIDAVLASLVGPMMQRPPMHSAIKQNGRPLYELARQGVVVDRAERAIEIERLVRIEYQSPMLVIDVTCSKGTYVRVLAETIGAALNCGASLTDLRRTRVAELSVEDAVTSEDLEHLSLEQRRALLLPIDALIGTLPRLDLDQATALRFAQGQRIWQEGSQAVARLRVYGKTAEGGSQLLGVGLIDEEAVLRPQRLIAVTA